MGHLSITVVKHHSQDNVQKKEFVLAYRTRWRVHNGGGGMAGGSQSRDKSQPELQQEAESANWKWALAMNHLRPSLGEQVYLLFIPPKGKPAATSVQMSNQWGIFLFQTATFTVLNFPGLVAHPDSPCFISLQSEFTVRLLSSLLTPIHSRSSRALSSSPSYLDTNKLSLPPGSPC